MTATLTFDDEFNGLSLYNSTTGKGTWDTTFYYNDGTGSKGSTLSSNGEQEWYINSDYAPTAAVKPWSVNNGVLTIQAAPASSAISSQINGYQYTSGQLNTYHSFSQTYGFFEIRAQLPSGQGLWPAFWLMPEDGSWPPELDVMEAIDKATTDYTTVHDSSIANGMSSQGVAADLSSGYHTFGVDWEPDHITWYLDGKEIYQVATPADMNKPMYMLLNLAVGGGWPGNADSTTPFPANYNVDWVRAYSSNPYSAGNPDSANPALISGASSAPATTTSTAPATAASTPATSSHVFTSPGPGSVETGTTGADTFYASQGNDTLTGNGGGDVFVFQKQPWAPDHITDFHLGSDKLDLSALFQAAGYTGSDPVADHYITLESDGHGGTNVRFDASGQANINGHWPTTIIDLEGVSPNGLTWGQLTGTATAASTGSTGSTGSTSSGGAATGSSGAATTAGAAGSHVFTSPGPNSVETGTTGADTFYASQGYDTLTGNGGGDVFVFQKEPWAPDHITDFHVGTDKLDLSALFQAAGYTGSDPVADHYIALASDGNGGTLVRFDHTGQANINGHWPNTIIDLEHVSPTNLTWGQLSGTAGSAAATGSTAGAATGGASGAATAATGTAGAGQVFTSPNPGSVEVGTAGNDTFNASQGADTLTGGAGDDVFVFNKEPWAPIHITDFTPGHDKLDLRALFQAAGYTGSNPIADHYITVDSDGNGGSMIRFDHTGQANINGHWPNSIIDLQHVAPSQVSASDWIIH